MKEPSPLRIRAQTRLRDPILVLAYGGWNDGGESATTAVQYLLGQLAASRLASIETEDFLDFTVARPNVRRREGVSREIVWPNHEFFTVQIEGTPGDLILGLGMEPHLRWRAYCDAVIELARAARVRFAVLLGAYLADVIYSRPVQVGGFTLDPELATRLGLGPSSYEGPTGIVGVLTDALQNAGFPAASLWAALPHYVTTTPNSRGALALLQRLETVTELRFDLSSLEETAATFDQKVSELIASDPQLSAYVRELKRRAFSQ